MIDVARMESGHTPSRSHPEWWDGEVPWIGIADARDHHGATIQDTAQHTNGDGLANSAARLLPVGTVCVSRTASVGYVVVLGRPMATSQDFVNWVCTEALDPHWVRLVFLADRDALIRFGRGSVHKTIYFPELLSLHIAIPPLAEQYRIVAEVDRQLSVQDALAATIDANLARCAQLRQAILKRAFEGRLVPALTPADSSTRLAAQVAE
jgi:type I restriction enzyme S subunit